MEDLFPNPLKEQKPEIQLIMQEMREIIEKKDQEIHTLEQLKRKKDFFAGTPLKVIDQVNKLKEQILQFETDNKELKSENQYLKKVQKD